MVSLFKRLPHTSISRSQSVLLSLVILAGTMGWSQSTPSVGDKAPDFSLSSIDGKTVQLSEELQRGPVVLVMLRGWPGYQCPYCTRQVGDFLTHAKEISAAGGSVILVYPGPAEQLKEHALEFKGNKEIPENFKLLLDPDYSFTRAYALRWDAPAETSYPATFVIDKGSVVRFSLVSKTHGGRAAASDVIKVLSTLGK